MGSGASSSARRYDYSRNEDDSITQEEWGTRASRALRRLRVAVGMVGDHDVNIKARELASISGSAASPQSRSPSVSPRPAGSSLVVVNGVKIPTLGLQRWGSFSSMYTAKPVQARLLLVSLYHKHPFVDYRYVKELGRGSFSVVHKAVRVGSFDDRNLPEVVALKEYDPKRVRSSVLTAVQFEMNILSQLSHPAVVALYAVYSTPEKLSLAMEYLRGGEVLKTLGRKKLYLELDGRRIVRQVAEALAHLHSRDVIHRDIKPENLIFKDHDDTSPVKVVDFGLCLLVSSITPATSEVVCGTKGYLAPEVITAGQYSPACDCWALGVLSYILLSGTMPFSPVNLRSAVEGTYHLTSQQWQRVSHEGRDFIRRLLCVQPGQRMTAAESLDHPWMTQVDAAAASLAFEGAGGSSQEQGGSSQEYSMELSTYSYATFAPSIESLVLPIQDTKGKDGVGGGVEASHPVEDSVGSHRAEFCDLTPILPSLRTLSTHRLRQISVAVTAVLRFQDAGKRNLARRLGSLLVKAAAGRGTGRAAGAESGGGAGGADAGEGGAGADSDGSDEPCPLPLLWSKDTSKDTSKDKDKGKVSAGVDTTQCSADSTKSDTMTEAEGEAEAEDSRRRFLVSSTSTRP